MSTAATTTSEGSLWSFRWYEARRVIGARTALALAIGIALLLATQLAIPALPRMAKEVLERAFGLEGMASLLLLNDHLAVYVTLALFAQIELSRVVIVPMEERQLALLLSKPITVPELFFTRALPVLVAQGILGVVLTSCERALVAGSLGAQAQVSSAGVWAGGVIVTAMSIVVASLALVVQVLASERERGMLAGAVLVFGPLVGSAVLAYRPDVYVGRPLLRLLTTFPGSLCLHDASLAAIAPWFVLGALATSALSITLAARIFVARDLV